MIGVDAIRGCGVWLYFKLDQWTADTVFIEISPTGKEHDPFNRYETRLRPCIYIPYNHKNVRLYLSNRDGKVVCDSLNNNRLRITHNDSYF